MIDIENIIAMLSSAAWNGLGIIASWVSSFLVFLYTFFSNRRTRKLVELNTNRSYYELIQKFEDEKCIFISKLNNTIYVLEHMEIRRNTPAWYDCKKVLVVVAEQYGCILSKKESNYIKKSLVSLDKCNKNALHSNLTKLHAVMQLEGKYKK